MKAAQDLIREIIARAHPAKQTIDNADMRGFRRNKTAHLRQDRDQSILAQEGGFTRHVRAREQPQGSLVFAQQAIIGDEA